MLNCFLLLFPSKSVVRAIPMYFITLSNLCSIEGDTCITPFSERKRGVLYFSLISFNSLFIQPAVYIVQGFLKFIRRKSMDFALDGQLFRGRK